MADLLFFSNIDECLMGELRFPFSSQDVEGSAPLQTGHSIAPQSARSPFCHTYHRTPGTVRLPWFQSPFLEFVVKAETASVAPGITGLTHCHHIGSQVAGQAGIRTCLCINQVSANYSELSACREPVSPGEDAQLLQEQARKTSAPVRATHEVGESGSMARKRA